MELEPKLNEVFRRVFREPNLNVFREMAAKDVAGWDSITHTEMIAEVEAAFGVTFKLKEITKWKCVGDMMDTLTAKL